MQWINLAVINVEANKWPERHTENIWCWSMGNFWKRRLHATNVENILQIFNAFKIMWNSLIQQQMNLLKFNAIVKNVPKFLLMLKASMLIWKHVLKTLQIWPVPYVQLKTGKFQYHFLNAWVKTTMGWLWDVFGVTLRWLNNYTIYLIFQVFCDCFEETFCRETWKTPKSL